MLARIVALIFIAFSAMSFACTVKEDQGSGPAAIPAPPDVAAPPPDAKVTPSGLASKILRVGFSNVHPSARSNIKVIYTGWTTDGKMFETSTTAGHAAGPFPLEQMIPGWIEGLPLMVVGEKRRFWIPAALAYNNDPNFPKGMLVFDIELVEVR